MKAQIEFTSCWTFSTRKDRCCVCMYVYVSMYILMSGVCQGTDSIRIGNFDKYVFTYVCGMYVCKYVYMYDTNMYHIYLQMFIFRYIHSCIHKKWNKAALSPWSPRLQHVVRAIHMHRKESQVESIYGRGIFLRPRAVYIVLLFGIAGPLGQSRRKKGLDWKTFAPISLKWRPS